jgi:hypothetical protein
LLGRHFTAVATPPAVFALAVLEMKVSFCAQAGPDHDPPIYTFCCSRGDRHSATKPSFISIEVGSHFFAWAGLEL